MPGKLTIKVAGAKQIELALKELGAAAANRIARSSLNRGATPVVRRARELAAEDTGELKRSISKRLRRHRAGSDRQTILIGVEKPRSRISRLLEFGAAHMAPRPFLRPALDLTVSEALRIQQEAMAEGVEREVRKLAAKTLARAGFRA
jgi:HK97 gp10 family phage protein